MFSKNSVLNERWPMKVAIDLRSISPNISGVENYLLNILESSAFHKEERKETGNSNAEKNSRRNNLELFGIYNSNKQSIQGLLHSRNIELPFLQRRVPNRFFNAFLTFFSAPKFEKFFCDFDILWMPDLRPFALRKKTGFALTVHDLSPVMHSEFYSFKRRLWHKVIRYEKSFQRADLIFAVSEYTKYDLVKYYGLNPEKIKVVYPGINHEIFKQSLDERLGHKVRLRYNLPQDYILSISTLEPRKNILALIKAFEQIDDPHVELIIAGKKGWLYGPILKKVRSSQKKDKIRLIGYVEEKDKPFLLSMAKIVCYPSFYEGFGFVPLEAMACGVPVITSARTSMPEICSDAALLIEPMQLSDLAKAINELLADSALRQEMVVKGIARSKLFSWEMTAEKIISELQNLNPGN